ncbi:MAG TPA: zinc ABC transporter substrate-binding protein [Bauldia sp.]|nr:zinc ABC transporter substrate-binding protein [Bauldia sp.]
MFLRSLVFGAAFAFPLAGEAAELPITIVAAESFYGEVAAAIGGDRVAVEGVALSPDADPHDFAPPPSASRAVADARIVIMNGLGYDHWMAPLLDASENADRVVLEVAALVGAEEGGNPHLWYDPSVVPALATALTATLATADPEGTALYESRLAEYTASLRQLDQRVTAIRDRYAGTEVVASEPVFGLMADALGLRMLGEDFQRAVMNETEPSAGAIAEVEDHLRSGRAKVLFYNSQVVDPLTERLLAIAKEANVPVVPVTESMPEGQTYVGWMLDQLDATAKALAAPSS